MKSILLVLFVFLPCVLFAREPGTVLTESKSIAAEIRKSNKEEAALIYHWLSNTSETRIHQLRGAVDNVVYVHKDGHTEAVFDGEGNMVRDGINDGSYNYAHPEGDPINHFNKDILPWIFWGYSREDPTSIEERLIAYSEALGGGLVLAQEKEIDLSKTRKLTKSERSGIAVFMRVIESGEVSEIYDILRDPSYESKDPFSVGDRLTRGLVIVIKGETNK